MVVPGIGTIQGFWERIREDPAIYPPKEILDRCVPIEDLGKTTQLIDQL